MLAKRYFFFRWLTLALLMSLVFGLLIFLVFFAMLFMQLEQAEISLLTILYWVTLQVSTLFVALASLMLILSLLFALFYFEQNGELKAFYLIGLKFNQLIRYIVLLSVVIIGVQQWLSQSAVPSWKMKERELNELYLNSGNNLLQRINFIHDEYLVEIRVYNAQREEIRGITMALINIKNAAQQGDYIWLDAVQASWQGDGWLLSQVRLIDKEQHWVAHEALLLTDILPSPAILSGLIRSSAWAEKSSKELSMVHKDKDTSNYTRLELKYQLIDRFTQWLVLMWLLLIMQDYDPSRSWALWRAALETISGFMLFQVIRLWAEVALEEGAIGLFLAILLPHIILLLWAVLLKYIQKRQKNRY